MDDLSSVELLRQSLKRKIESKSKQNKQNTYISGKEFYNALKLAISYDQDQVIIKFFEDLDKYSHIIDNIDSKEYIIKANKYQSLIEKNKIKLRKFLKEAPEYNLQIVKKENYLKKIAFFENPEVSDKIIYYDIYSYTINDININLNDLKHNKLISYEASLKVYYGDLQKYNPDKLKKKYLKLNKKVKIFPFLKRKYLGEIKHIETTLNKVESLKKRIESIEKNINVFNELNDSQKTYINKFLNFLNEYSREPEGYNNNNTIDIISSIYGYKPKLKYLHKPSSFITNDQKRNKYERALLMMKEKGKLSQEREQIIMKEFKKVNNKIINNYYKNHLGKNDYANEELARYLEMSKRFDSGIKGFLSFLYPQIDLNGKLDIEKGIYKNSRV